MIYTSTDFICLDISMFLVFLILCLSDIINKCKSNNDIISNLSLVIYNHQIHQVVKVFPFELMPETTFVEV